jgi:hypothetical protein
MMESVRIFLEIINKAYFVGLYVPAIPPYTKPFVVQITPRSSIFRCCHIPEEDEP